MNLPLFIARRIYSDNGDARKVSRPAICIATAGVAIGLAVMIVSVCVIFGFKHTIRDKVVGICSNVTVASYPTLHGDNQSPVCLSDSTMSVIKRTPLLKHWQRYAVTQGILKTDSDFMGVAFKGVAEEFDTTFLHKCIKAGSIPRFSADKSGNKILISESIANRLAMKVGDRVFAYFFADDNVKVRRFTIEGIYQTNMSKMDETLCFTDLNTARRINGWDSDQVSGIELELSDFNGINAAGSFLVKNINRTTDRKGETFSSASVTELYPQIFSWLGLLDLNVWIILALMTCVAAITIISGLLIIILERTNMIGVLKALGCDNSQIRHTFLWYASFIIGRGILIGDVIGIGIVVLQQLTRMVKLDAAVYYVDYVPVELQLPLIIIINITTLLICLLVFVGPSYIVSHILPSKSMKYE